MIDEIIFAVESRELAGMEGLLLYDEEGMRTRVIVDFFPHVNSDVYLDRLGSMPLLTFSAAPHDEIRLLLTPDGHCVGGGGAGPAPALYGFDRLTRAADLARTGNFPSGALRLERVVLYLYKSRSMCDNAEALKPQLIHLNHHQTAFKIPKDPSSPASNVLLRNTSIENGPSFGMC